MLLCYLALPQRAAMLFDSGCCYLGVAFPQSAPLQPIRRADRRKGGENVSGARLALDLPLLVSLTDLTMLWPPKSLIVVSRPSSSMCSLRCFQNACFFSFRCKSEQLQMRQRCCSCFFCPLSALPATTSGPTHALCFFAICFA